MFKEQQASTKHRVMKKQRLSPHKPFCVQKPFFGWSKNPPPSDNCVLFTWKYLLWHFSSMCGVAAIPCFHPFSVLAESLSCVFFLLLHLLAECSSTYLHVSWPMMEWLWSETANGEMPNLESSRMFPIPQGVFAFFFGIWFLFLGHFLPTLGLGFDGDFHLGVFGPFCWRKVEFSQVMDCATF